MKEALAVGHVICALVGAKWALELGFSQVRQLIILIGGLLLGPLMLLILYVHLILRAKREGQPGGRIL